MRRTRAETHIIRPLGFCIPMPMTLEGKYVPESKKVYVDNMHKGYYSESVVITLPIKLTLSGGQEANILSSDLGVSTASPMATIFLTDTSLPNVLFLGGRTEADFRLTISYKRLEEVEKERRRIIDSGKAGDVILKIEGKVALMGRDGSLSVPTLAIGQGELNHVSIRDIDWNDVLVDLGYPRKRFIVIDEEVYNALTEYKQKRLIRDDSDAILDALRRAPSKTS